MAMHPDLPTSLLESPTFQLERLRRRIRDEVDRSLASEDVYIRELWVLTCLVEHRGANQSQLCSILGLDASDMVRHLDNLENKGWAKRQRDVNDRRRHIVVPTSEGVAAQSKLSAIVSQAEDRVLDESTHKQLKHLRKLAKAIIEDA